MILYHLIHILLTFFVFSSESFPPGMTPTIKEETGIGFYGAQNENDFYDSNGKAMLDYLLFYSIKTCFTSNCECINDLYRQNNFVRYKCSCYFWIDNANGCSNTGCRTFVTIDEESHHDQTNQKKTNSKYWDFSNERYKLNLQLILKNRYISIVFNLFRYLPYFCVLSHPRLIF